MREIADLLDQTTEMKASFGETHNKLGALHVDGKARDDQHRSLHLKVADFERSLGASAHMHENHLKDMDALRHCAQDLHGLVNGLQDAHDNVHCDLQIHASRHN